MRPPEFVYPGHPVVIGVCIMRKYASLSEAEEKGRHSPAALEDSDIPGAGGCVYTALACINHALDRSIDEAVAVAGSSWASCDDQKERYPARWADGVDGAMALEPEYRRRLAEWGAA